MTRDDSPGSEFLSELLQFPVGTISLYGPDAEKTTKIVAEILFDPHSESLRRDWVGSDVATNPEVQDELARFISKHQPACVLSSDGNIACVHLAGEDFPLGEDCPFCPYWKGRSPRIALRRQDRNSHKPQGGTPPAS